MAEGSVVGRHYEELGVTFRSKDDEGPVFLVFQPTDTAEPTVIIGDFVHRPGGTLNIVIEFSPAITFVSADVFSAIGYQVIMTAKDAVGNVLGGAISPTVTQQSLWYPFVL
jgi:hypothetical protein